MELLEEAGTLKREFVRVSSGVVHFREPVRGSSAGFCFPVDYRSAVRMDVPLC